MTQEDKQLLLKDICARLPYGVIIEGLSGPVKLSDYYSRIDITKARLYKPYLRPMSSMTEEERREAISLGISWAISGNKKIFDGFGNVGADIQIKGLDWLNAHHFDYRGLIEKGLAIEVTKENNPYERF